MRCYIQNFKTLGLPLSEKKNFEICLLCFYAPICDPQSRSSPDPRGITWTNLVEIHNETLHTKYQNSGPSSLREKELWSFRSLFLHVRSTCDPQGGASFDPRGILWINLVEVHKEITHTKQDVFVTHECPRNSHFLRNVTFIFELDLCRWPWPWYQQMRIEENLMCLHTKYEPCTLIS